MYLKIIVGGFWKAIICIQDIYTLLLFSLFCIDLAFLAKLILSHFSRSILQLLCRCLFLLIKFFNCLFNQHTHIFDNTHASSVLFYIFVKILLNFLMMFFLKNRISFNLYVNFYFKLGDRFFI